MIASNLTGKELRGLYRIGAIFIAPIRMGKRYNVRLESKQVEKLLEHVLDEQKTDAWAAYDQSIGKTKVYL